MQEACLCSQRNSKEANEAGGVRTRVAAVGTREGPADQTVCNLRGQEPDFWFSSEPGCLWGEGNGTLLQYSCLENPMDRGAWWATVHGVAKSQTRLSHFIFTFHFHALEKEMATHSSVLAWRIPGTGEPRGLPSMGSHRVGHD